MFNPCYLLTLRYYQFIAESDASWISSTRFLQKNFLEPAAAKRSTKSDVSAREQELESEVESQKQGGNQKQVANLRLPG